MKVVSSHEGRNVGWGCSRIGCEKIFRTKFEETRGRRKSYYWELHEWYSLWSIIRGDEVKNEMGWECGVLGEKRFVNMVFSGEHEEKWSFGRYSRRWKDNVKMWLEVVEWTSQGQNSGKSQATVNLVVNCRSPYNTGNLLSNWETVVSSTKTLLFVVSNCREL